MRSKGVLTQAPRMILTHPSGRPCRSCFAQCIQVTSFVLISISAWNGVTWCIAQEITRAISSESLSTLSQRLDALGPLLEKRELASPEKDLAAVQKAYDELVSYLTESSDPANRDAWLTYIDVPEEISDRSNAASSLPNADSLNSLRWRLSRNLPGIEREPLVRFRQATRHLAARLSIWQRREREQIAKAALKRLSAFFSDGKVPTGSAEVAELNRFLWYLDATGMLPEASEMLRREVGQPNVRVVVGDDFLREVYRQPVVIDGPSDEWILGTRVVSDTSLRGNVSVELLPSRNTAKLQLILDADFFSEGIGYNRGVRVFNEGIGDVQATRVLTLGNTGFSAQPVQASADLDTNIKGVSHQCKLVRKIASRRAAEQKSEANSIATGRLVNRVRHQFQNETDARLAQSDGERLRSIDLLLRRLDVSPIEREWSSTKDALELTLRAASPTQVTTAIAPPEIESPQRLVLQLHQSVIENTATEVLGGRTLDEKDFDEFGRTLFASGLVPVRAQLSEAGNKEDAAIDRSTRPLTIEFLGISPIIFDVRGGEIRTAVRGVFSTQGSRDRSLLEIAAIYRFEKALEGSPRLIRVGETSVTFLDEAGKPKRGILLGGVANVVRQRALQLLPENVPLPPLNWPRSAADSSAVSGRANQSPDAKSTDQLQLYVDELVAEDGWITARFR